MKSKLRVPEEIIIKGKTLREILDQHKIWLDTHGEKGELANLHMADLSVSDMSGVDLSEANLPNAKLDGTNLFNANLTGANLSNASFYRSKFSHTNMHRAHLSGANLSDTNLYDVNLSKSILRGTILCRATLRSTNLSRADLSSADLNRAVLSDANLDRAKLTESVLHSANLSGANLSGADLTAADLRRANLDGANLSGACLNLAICVRTNFTNAIIVNASIYGISVWDAHTEGLQQNNLIITKKNEPEITVDNLEVAQFIYLILNNQKIREVIDTITSKMVLILGSFTPERKIVLEAIREVLRQRGYVPVLFDFEKPASRDITETVTTLARLARFILADITDAKSIPQELMAIVPDLPSVPVKPILLASQKEYAMFEHFRRFPWVLETYLYTDNDMLMTALSEDVIGEAEKKVEEIRNNK